MYELMNSKTVFKTLVTKMSAKKKDLSEVTNEEALAYLDALFCQAGAKGS